jgi:hypothetical protein
MTSNQFRSRTRSITLVLGALLWLLANHPAVAEYVARDIQTVPVERLIRNLEQLTRRHPRDAQTRFNLARVHATAEAAGYLIRLLDPEKDKNEIATLRSRSAEADNKLRAITPVVIPLRSASDASALVDCAAKLTPQIATTVDAEDTEDKS